METNTQKEFRCKKCHKLLAYDGGRGFEVKCVRCGTLNFHLEQMQEQVIITDPKGVILYTNDALERMTGYTSAEAIGKTPAIWGGLMPAEFYAEMWRQIRDEKKNILVTLQNRKKDGTVYTAELRISPILDTQGEILFFIGCERKIE